MIAGQHKGKVVAGGPAVKLMGAPWAKTPDSVPYDTLAMHNPLATFTSRGCPNRCAFCAVPKIEGDFVELAEWKPAPVVCDNNIMAASRNHFKRVIDSLMPFPYVDFNQGLDARLFTSWHAEQLARLNKVMVRFAFDHVNNEGAVGDALQTARNAGLRHFRIYVLIGFKDTPGDARYRLDWVRAQCVYPNPMRYQPLDTTEKNSYVAPNWTERELRRMMQYYSRLIYYEHIPFDKFVYLGDPSQMELGLAERNVT